MLADDPEDWRSTLNGCLSWQATAGRAVILASDRTMQDSWMVSPMESEVAVVEPTAG